MREIERLTTEYRDNLVESIRKQHKTNICPNCRNPNPLEPFLSRVSYWSGSPLKDGKFEKPGHVEGYLLYSKTRASKLFIEHIREFYKQILPDELKELVDKIKDPT
jgi:hypothetical protein